MYVRIACKKICLLICFVLYENVLLVPINLFLTFNDDVGIVTDAYEAIEQKIPSICPVSLCYFNYTQMSNLINYWSVFINKHRDLVVMIPEKGDESIQQKYGFKNLMLLNLTDAEESLRETIKSRYDVPKSDIKDLVSHFENLFDLECSIPKCIFITGHGSAASKLIAQMPIETFIDFTKILLKIGTKFLYVNSCFSGSKNIVYLQRAINSAFGIKEYSISFPIVIDATMEAPVPGGIVYNLSAFFKNLNTWLETQSTDALVLAISALCSNAQNVANLPSIRFPGINSFFRTVHLNKLELITSDFAQKMKDKKEKLKIEDSIKYLMIYPSDLNHLDIDVNASKMPFFVSMLTGKACHFINSIDCFQQHSLEEILNVFVFAYNENFHSQKKGYIVYYGKYNKAWFIKTLVYDEGKRRLNNVLIYRDVSDFVNPKLTMLYYDPVNKQYFLLENYPLSIDKKNYPFSANYKLEDHFNIIKSHTFQDKIEQILNNVIASKKSLFEATEGRESQADIKELISALRNQLLISELHYFKDEVKKGRQFGSAIAMAQKYVQNESDEQSSLSHLSLDIFATAEEYLNKEVLVRIKKGDFARAKSFVNQLPDELNEISNKFPYKKVKLWFRTRSIPMLKNKFIIIATSCIEYDIQTATRLLQALSNKEIISVESVGQLITSMKNLDKAKQLFGLFKEKLVKYRDFNMLNEKFVREECM